MDGLFNWSELCSVDVLVISAMQKEINPLVKRLQAGTNEVLELPVPDVGRFPRVKFGYKLFLIKNVHGEILEMVVTWTEGYGNIKMADYLQQCIDCSNPRFAAMCGICAGRLRKTEKGDIVVASQAFLMDSGEYKSEKDGSVNHQPNLDVVDFSGIAKHYAQEFDGWDKYVIEMEKPLPVNKSKGERIGLPKVKIGPMASGNAVRRDYPFKEITNYVRDVLALDMESYAFGYVLNNARTIPSIIAKSVCDFGDNKKDDKYHEYCCFASSAYIFAFIINFVCYNKFATLKKGWIIDPLVKQTIRMCHQKGRACTKIETKHLLTSILRCMKFYSKFDNFCGECIKAVETKYPHVHEILKIEANYNIISAAPNDNVFTKGYRQCMEKATGFARCYEHASYLRLVDIWHAIAYQSLNSRGTRMLLDIALGDDKSKYSVMEYFKKVSTEIKIEFPEIQDEQFSSQNE